MQAGRDRGPVTHAVMAISGGLLFAGSLAYFAVKYLHGFDAPASGAVHPAASVIINVLLFSLFALHHSLFARTGLKAVVSRAVPPSLERSTYVWIASLLFIAVCAWWQPVPGIAWHVTGGTAVLLYALQAIGGVFTLIAARRLDVLELSGVRQALRLPLRRGSGLDESGPYGVVRHPIYFAWLLLVWPAPVMNGTRLVFAIVSTAYLIVAIPYEERDLRRQFGDVSYDNYARKVRWRLVPYLY